MTKLDKIGILRKTSLHTYDLVVTKLIKILNFSYWNYRKVTWNTSHQNEEISKLNRRIHSQKTSENISEKSGFKVKQNNSVEILRRAPVFQSTTTQKYLKSNLYYMVWFLNNGFMYQRFWFIFSNTAYFWFLSI